ncbi:MAG: hypothetical protein ABR991_04490 [Terracidiphilus sp.]|jgi:hypothetical protein
MIGVGLLFCIGGIVAIAMSDGKVIFFGAVLWGGWMVLKGLGRLMTGD